MKGESSMAEQKTNVMRTLEQKKVAYTAHFYPHGDEAVDGVTAAALIGKRPEEVYKTLVTRGAGGGIYVFVIPVAEELDLKKCALAAGDKRMEMIAVKELLPLTGYVRGGCSPVGMKKPFPTFFDETATLFDKFYVSAGMRGKQFCLNPIELCDFLGASFADLTMR